MASEEAPATAPAPEAAPATAKEDGGKGNSSNLPRKRIMYGQYFVGQVMEWKGKYGWVKPTEPIQHEKAEKREGKIFVSKTDLVGCEELTPGKLVQFHVFADATGLGGEECLQA
mmetsp:Transcript_23954/g.43410  ORF Transcript_23954/g.43410 Transcript_23954/m.43410 type:complete len:114 (+) Transcript_23954:100-441(+)